MTGVFPQIMEYGAAEASAGTVRDRAGTEELLLKMAGEYPLLLLSGETVS